MTEDEKEFEEVWKDKTWMGFELGRKLFKTDPRIIEMVKRISLFYWLESRRRFIAQLREDSKLAGFDIEEWDEEIVDQMKGEEDEHPRTL
jgi:hypothetical protein